ncbi:PC4/YdbC family ssDNA-binding protein [Romboutsia sedimentorum]|uniref:PC4/YdbC family ssDNA-binding protein n=1 Tax=Romboutsia sedimentorum TaxID=1368474 RepID=A0ABT7EAE7_9FIRM|nr:PC4/YdbC family ssDNA-binding protein [Romboutsia sedimentorum]MDK2562480.1 PC4/YdbC family ssDNA-binding protein [Romboutsia sedimentorum]MDK2584722.1 PC4/YdbC family ssDNA-binding protein [Romboutsia sedimentorum]
MAEIKFEIQEEIGVISNSGKGWTKELNLVSWNNNAPKFDLRDWSSNHEKMGKGITLTNEDLKALKDLLNEMNL